MPNGITINQHTTLQQVGDHLNNDPNKDRQLLARTNKHGEVVLYSRPQAKNVIDKISHFIDRQTGRTERREARARDALIGLVDRLGTSHSEPSKGLFKNIKDAVTNWSANREMTGHVVSLLSLATRGLPEKTEPLPPGPTLGSLGIAKDSSFIRETAQKLGADPTNKALWQELAEDLGEELVTAINSRNPDSVRDEFAMSDGIRFMTGLSEALSAELGKLTPPVQVTKDALNSIVQTAFFGAASKVRDDGILLGEGKQVKGEEHPYITIGGEHYEPTRLLGSGGFGRVFEYVSVDDPTKKIALKVSFDLGQRPMGLGAPGRNNYAEAMRGAFNETNLHRQVFSDGTKEIVGYVTHFRLPDGNVAIAMESAPNGNVEDMGKSLKEAVDKKTITQDEANVLRLTMLQDITKGLEHMHADNIAHLDFKGQNCLIGLDGTAKVSDFGLTKGLALGEDGNVQLKHTDMVVPEFDHYLAPEMVSAKTTVKELDASGSQQVKSTLTKVASELAKIFPRGTKPILLEGLAGNVLQDPITNIKDRNADLKSGLKYDHKVDVWGLGMSAIELFTGSRPYAHLGVGDDAIGATLVAFGKNADNQPLSDPDRKKMLVDGPSVPGSNAPPPQVEVEVDVPKPGAIGLKTGVPQIDDLMTQMLRPRAEDRSGTPQLLKHSAFGMPGVGSKEARDLIVALKSGDQQKITDARRALNGLMPQSQGTISSTSSTPTPQSLTLTMEEVEALTGGNVKLPPLPQTPRGEGS